MNSLCSRAESYRLGEVGMIDAEVELGMIELIAGRWEGIPEVSIGNDGDLLLLFWSISPMLSTKRIKTCSPYIAKWYMLNLPVHFSAE